MEGTKQGKIKGSSPQKGNGGLSYSDRMECHDFNYAVVTQTDPSSGAPVGKRQHNPITVRKKTDVASPQLFQAALTNAGFRSGIPVIGSSGSGASSGKGHHHPITVTRETDSASPKLFQALLTNELFKEVKIHFSVPGGGKHILKLTHAVIANIRRVSFPGAKGPGEQVEFFYNKLEKMLDFSR